MDAGTDDGVYVRRCNDAVHLDAYRDDDGGIKFFFRKDMFKIVRDATGECFAVIPCRSAHQ